MPQHGYIKRSKPRVEVLRGYNPNEPHTLSQSHPVKANVTIKSGQVISLTWVGGNSRYEWQLGCADGLMGYIALQDWDQSVTGGLGAFGYDPDVIEAGKLTGLSCAGQFEIQTAYFKTGESYPMDQALTFDGVTGDLKPAGSSDQVLGRITRPSGQSGARDLTGIHSGASTLDVIIFTTGFVAKDNA
jgi:hypothetical protein